MVTHAILVLGRGSYLNLCHVLFYEKIFVLFFLTCFLERRLSEHTASVLVLGVLQLKGWKVQGLTNETKHKDNYHCRMFKTANNVAFGMEQRLPNQWQR